MFFCVNFFMHLVWDEYKAKHWIYGQDMINLTKSSQWVALARSKMVHTTEADWTGKVLLFFCGLRLSKMVSLPAAAQHLVMIQRLCQRTFGEILFPMCPISTWKDTCFLLLRLQQQHGIFIFSQRVKHLIPQCCLMDLINLIVLPPVLPLSKNVFYFLVSILDVWDWAHRATHGQSPASCFEGEFTDCCLGSFCLSSVKSLSYFLLFVTSMRVSSVSFNLRFKPQAGSRLVVSTSAFLGMLVDSSLIPGPCSSIRVTLETPHPCSFILVAPPPTRLCLCFDLTLSVTVVASSRFSFLSSSTHLKLHFSDSIVFLSCVTGINVKSVSQGCFHFYCPTCAFLRTHWNEPGLHELSWTVLETSSGLAVQDCMQMSGFAAIAGKEFAGMHYCTFHTLKKKKKPKRKMDTSHYQWTPFGDITAVVKWFQHACEPQYPLASRHVPDPGGMLELDVNNAVW